MSDEPKQPDYSNPERYKILANGAVYGLQEGHIVSSKGVSTRITPETSQLMHKRRKELGAIAHMRALAASEGLELPEGAELEELAQAAAKGIEALTLHMLNTFKASKNLRGMAESYSKLTTGFLDTDRSRADAPDLLPHRDPLMALLAQYIADMASRQDTSGALEGEILEEQKGE
jgi:hypothetical protein